jgi:hypothetical protein
MSRRNAPRQPDAVDAALADVERSMSSGDGVEPMLHVDPNQRAAHDRHEPLFDPDLPAPSGVPAPPASGAAGSIR